MHFRKKQKIISVLLIGLLLNWGTVPKVAIAEDDPQQVSTTNEQTEVSEEEKSVDLGDQSESDSQQTDNNSENNCEEELSSEDIILQHESEALPSNDSSTNSINQESRVATESAKINESDLPAEASSSAQLENDQDASTSGSLTTGDSSAVVNSLNLVNTTQQDSSVQAVSADITEGEGDVDLRQPDQKHETDEENTQSKEQYQSIEPTVTSVENDATVVIDTSASASSGLNQQQGSGDIELKTGSAKAVSNSVALINSLLINSDLQYYFINILHDFEGDIILPHQEHMLEIVSQACVTCLTLDQIEVSNQAKVDNYAASNANTGSNTQQVEKGSSTLSTGEASSTSIANTQANNVYQDLFLFALQVNNLSNWQGNIYGWITPDSVLQASSSLSLLRQENKHNLDSDLITPDIQAFTDSQVQLEFANNANVVVNTSATANTGNNLQNLQFGQANMETGDALAVANSEVQVNQLYINSNLWDGTINIMNDWSGHIRFAYPDLEVSFLESPSSFTQNQQLRYVVQVKNVGLADARDVEARVLLPGSVMYLSDTWVDSRLDGNNIFFAISELKSGDAVQITINAKALSSLTDGQVADSAAEVKGRYSELMDNNFALAIGSVRIARSVEENSEAINDFSESDPSPEDDPQFTISALSNINQFIYPGDTGIFSINAQNLGGISYNTRLYVMLVDPEGFQIGGGQVDLNTLKSGEKAKISFNMTVPPNGLSGQYQLITWLEGENYSGQLIQSADAFTVFDVRGVFFGSSGFQEIEGVPASFASADSGEIVGSILGESRAVSSFASLREMLYLGFLILTQFFVRKARVLFEL